MNSDFVKNLIFAAFVLILSLAGFLYIQKAKKDIITEVSNIFTDQIRRESESRIKLITHLILVEKLDIPSELVYEFSGVHDAPELLDDFSNGLIANLKGLDSKEEYDSLIKFQSGNGKSPVFVRVNREYGLIGFGNISNIQKLDDFYPIASKEDKYYLSGSVNLEKFMTLEGQVMSDIKSFPLSDSLFYSSWGLDRNLNWDSLYFNIQ